MVPETTKLPTCSEEIAVVDLFRAPDDQHGFSHHLRTAPKPENSDA